MSDSTYPDPLGRANSIIADGSDRRQSPAQTGYAGQALAEQLLAKIFKHLHMRIAVRLWSGPALRVGGGVPVPTEAAAAGTRTESAAAEPEAPFALWFRTPAAVVAMVLGRDPLRLAEAYFRGEVDIEGDLFAALALKDHLEEIKLSLAERWAGLLMAVKLRSLNRGLEPADPHARHEAERSPAYRRAVSAHSSDASRQAIRFHYDVSNEFYKLWLDRAMVYSCGYFERADAEIDEAQQAKLEHICRKLLLKPGERFLDIGCGWGALVIHAARHHGVRAHGITLSCAIIASSTARLCTTRWRASAWSSTWDSRICPCISTPSGECSRRADYS
jgi:cyclopropane-fatty-acyl-phospholipid synthase